MSKEIITPLHSDDNTSIQFLSRPTIRYLIGYISNMSKGVCHARQKIIARHLGISERQVRRHLHRLAEMGIITIDKIQTRLGMLQNCYRTNFERLSELTDQLKKEQSYPQEEEESSGSTSGITTIYKYNKINNKPIHTSCPKDLVPTNHQVQVCLENGLNWLDVLSDFMEYNLSKGNLFKNWINALTGWILNAIRFKKFKEFGKKLKNSFIKSGGDMAKPLPVRETFIPLPEDFKKSDRRSALIYQIDIAKALNNGKKVIQLQQMLDELNSIHENDNGEIGEVFF